MTSPVKYTSQNTVTIFYDLTLGDGTRLTGRRSCTSGSSLGVPEYYHRKADSDGGFRHRYDPDAQVFDWLANEVWKHYGRHTATYTAGARNTTGTILVADAQGPCRSCRYVFNQFKREYPGVTITVKYPKRGVIPQTAGLFSQYGYEDAVEDTGMWVKIFR